MRGVRNVPHAPGSCHTMTLCRDDSQARGSTAAQDGITSTARELSTAFRSVARQSVPSVAFITVGKTLEAGNPSALNNPFDSFDAIITWAPSPSPG